ncbi:hypothetical protein TspCOW1_12730 [Thiohalobacter sp. COW1]|uniref:hypothetical protein n=1 Tax=Thiohalobacter sp. COW1 TaxID=2795687 RepID=UPI001914EEA6|nr:hypothetical protein [Thiohalobacter sp. COW1]BCO31170.1 hypothetical protein TspCOW1_12730 [Thiohalobacter sp. COW1]
MKDWNWKHVVLFILAIPVVNYMAGYLGKSASQHVNERERATLSSPSPYQEIRVVVTSQNSQGVTQHDFDLNFLHNLEAYAVERAKQKTKEYLASEGYPNTNIDFSSEAIYVESGSVKLAVVRLRASEGVNQVLIVGIIDNELKRISCLRSSIEAIPISYGVCADKIKEVFGVKIGA